MHASKNDYKAGDRLRIIHLPSGIRWAGGAVEIGGEIVLFDPPTRPIRHCDYDYTALPFMLSFGDGTLWIPPEWVEPIDTSIPKVCECPIMVTGCTCGAFEEELRRKEE